MNARTTWSLVFAAALLFAFIYFIEFPYRKAQHRPPEMQVLPHFTPTNVTSIQIQTADQVDLRIDRTNGTWRLTRPIAYAADVSKVATLLHSLSQLVWQGHISAAELQDRPDAQEEFGLATPQYSIAIEEGKYRRRLLIGKKVAVGEQVFLQVVGGNGIYVVDAELLKAIPQTVDPWRDHSLLSATGVRFDTLRSKTTSSSFELHFNPTNYLWRMTKPLETRADNTKIADLLQKFSALQISQFVTDDPNVDLDKYGLQTPEIEIAFGQGSNEVFAVQVGQSPTNGPTEVYARRRGEQAVFLLPKEPLSGWRLPYSDFRERHLANLPEKAIDMVHIIGDDDFIVRKQSSNTWVVAGQTIPADSLLVQELLARLNLAEIEVEKNVVTDYAAYGLAKPTLSYTLQVTQPTSNQFRADPVTTIDFGTNNGKVFARRSDEASVFSIKSEDFTFLPRAAWQMRDRQIWNFDSADVINVLVQTNGQSRQFIRNAKGDWIIAPGSQGIVNTFSFEEAIHRLGHLRAVYWTARGEENLAKYGFKQDGHAISLQVKRAGKIETFDLQFGGMSEFRVPYAAVTLNGEKLIFEFPWPLYYDFVLHDLTIAPTAAPGPK